MKTKSWILLIALLLALSLGLSLWVFLRPGGQVAKVCRDGECILSVDLSQLTEAKTYTLSYKGHTNVIVAEPGRICIKEANCPDRVCVKSGWLSSRGAPLVCLPHHLVIRLEAGEAPVMDALTR